MEVWWAEKNHMGYVFAELANKSAGKYMTAIVHKERETMCIQYAYKHCAQNNVTHT